MSALENQYACDLLFTIASTHEASLKRGLMRRAEMLQAIERGEKPSGYRAEWISSTADAVLKTLRECAVKLHEAHPDDRASNLDFFDVLATAKMRIG